MLLESLWWYEATALSAGMAPVVMTSVAAVTATTMVLNDTMVMAKMS